MNCFNHPTQVAVAQCCDCSKGQCYSCATEYSMSICKPCNDRRLKNERNKIIKEMLFAYGIGFIITFFYFKDLKKLEVGGSQFIAIQCIAMFYISAGMVVGWQTLNKITPRIFLFLPLIGWFLYLFFKLILSMHVGLVMLPIRTIRNIRRLLQLSY